MVKALSVHSVSSAQDGLQIRSSTTWWTWGAYDFTCSMCWMFVVHHAPVMSLKRQVIRFDVSSAQACHASLSAFFPETFRVVVSSITGPAAAFSNGEVTFWWMCKMPPVVLFSRRQATGQPSSELGMRPRFTRSAMLSSWSWKNEIKTTSHHKQLNMICMINMWLVEVLLSVEMGVKIPL